jgi:two-component system, NtrC family, response regulator AtoC
VTVGRDEECDLCLRSDKVSRDHFTVHFSLVTGRFVLTDSGSLNGVKVNGRKVDGLQPLADGDRIAVAAYVLVFETA